MIITKATQCFCQESVDIVLTHEFCNKLEILSQEGQSFLLEKELRKYDSIINDSIFSISQANSTLRYAILLALNQQTVMAYNLGNKAIRYYSSEISDSTDVRGIGIIDAFTMVLNAYGLYSQALSIQTKSLELRKRNQIYGDGYAYALENIAVSYSKLRNYYEALRNFNKQKLFLEERNKKNTLQYASCLRNLAVNYLFIDDYDNFLLYENLAHKLYVEQGAKHDNYAHNSLMVSALLSKQRYNDAYLLSKENVLLAKSTYGSLSIQTIKSLQTELSSLVMVNDSMASLRSIDGKFHYFETNNETDILNRLDSIAQNINQNSIEQLTILENLIDYRIKKGKLEESDIWGDNDDAKLLDVNRKCSAICESILGTQNERFARLLMLRAHIYEQSGFLDEAALYSSKACKTIKRISREKLQGSPLYAYYLMHGAHYMMEAHKYDEALEMALYAKNIYTINNLDHLNEYASLLIGISDIYECKKQRNQSIFYSEEAIKLLKESSVSETVLIVSSLLSLADKYANLNVERYCQLISEAMQRGQNIQISTDLSLKMVGCVANMYIMQGKYDEALQMNNQLLLISKGRMNNIWTETTNAHLYTYLVNLYKKAEILSLKKDFYNSYHVINEGINFIEGNQDKANLISLIAYNFYSSKYFLCDILGKGSEKEICKNKIIELAEWDSTLSITKIIALTELLYQENERDKLISTIVGTSTKLDSLVISHFSGLSSSEREETWREYAVWFFQILPKYSYLLNNPIIRESAYNGALFAKGLLLNADYKIAKEIDNSTDPEIHHQQEILATKKNKFNKIVESGNIDNYDNYRLLSEQIRDLERSISLAVSSRFVNSYHSTTWKDIQNSLPLNSVAIEFMSFQQNKDSILYVALLVDKKCNSPYMIPLFNMSQLEKFSDTELYENVKGYKIVWKPLERYLKGVTNIYFSPTGIINNIAIESFFVNRKKHFGEKYKTYRLSSTRQIVINSQAHARPKKTVLFGGMLYSANSRQANYQGKQNIVDSEFLRSRLREASTLVQDLPNTIIEVDSIASILRNGGFEVKTYSKEAGTESNFKTATKNCEIIHIATHGFTQNRIDSTFLTKYGISQSAGYVEDFILDNTGLYMSGVNHYINDGKHPDGIDDGILTSREISFLDLSDADMVVLSACNSGLGTIASDGVLGLQRGFKKAGVNSLIVTLKSVYDEPSQKLMVHFYKNLIEKGQNKRDALMNAQKHIRDVLGYQDPKYWIPFILIDGLN